MRSARALALASALFASTVAAQTYRLPPEPAVALPPGDGAELTAAACAACHSLDYLTTQPPGRDKAFWAASVKKMVEVYGAEVTPADADRIAEYLSRR